MKRTKNMIVKETDESRELELFAMNESSLWNRSINPIINNLVKKANKGVYNFNKSVDLVYYAMNTASDLYNRYYGYSFDVTARYTAANNIAEYIRDEYINR